jgi:hypothetical protein
MKWQGFMWIVGLALILVSLAVWRAPAAPQLPKPPELPEELHSLALLRRVRLTVESLPDVLKDNGLSSEQMEELFRTHLVEGEFEFGDDGDLPHIVVQIMVDEHSSQPEALAMAVVMAVHQNVLVERLDERLRAPTTSMSVVRLTTMAGARETAEGLAVVVADTMSRVTKQVNKARDARRTGRNAT